MTLIPRNAEDTCLKTQTYSRNSDNFKSITNGQLDVAGKAEAGQVFASEASNHHPITFPEGGVTAVSNFGD